MVTVVNVDAFEQAYRSGLLFSLFEGLKEGEAFKVVSKNNLEEIKNYFITAQVRNMKFNETDSKQDLCEVEVKKVTSNGGNCCGMCGG